MGVKYEHPEDGASRQVPFEGVRFVACCDCGLVHTHTYAVEPHPTLKGKGVVVERIWRNNRATAQIRRKMARDNDIIAEPKSNVYMIMPRIVHKKRRHKVVAKYEPY